MDHAGEGGILGGIPERLGPCRLLREIGSGGTGTVFLAEMAEERPYAAAGERVAVKLLHPHAVPRGDAGSTPK